MNVAVPEYVIAVAVAGMAITLIVLPKRRRMGYTLYALLAIYIMAQLIDPALLAGVRVVPTLDNDALISLTPVALVTGLLILIILIVNKEEKKQ